MITLDLSILNQKGTPMFYSDLTANIPAAGIAGRIFIATDSPYGLFRDTGSAWEQIAGIGGGGGNTIYTADDTLTNNRVVSSGGFDLSFTSTTYIGSAAIGGGGSGKLIVGSSSADNGVQIFGANSPSLRLDNAQSGGTQRFVIGLSTATNNFIQGSAAGNICIATATSSPLLFGMWQTINAAEVMRLSTSSNILIGTSIDNGNKVNIVGRVRIGGLSNSTCLILDNGIQIGSYITLGEFTFSPYMTTNVSSIRCEYGTSAFGGNNYSAGNPQIMLSGSGGSIAFSFGSVISGGGGSPWATMKYFYGDGSMVLQYSASAILQVTSSILTLNSTIKGFLKPRMTNAQVLAISSPVAGLEVYNTDLNEPCFYNGSSWRKINNSPM